MRLNLIGIELVFLALLSISAVIAACGLVDADTVPLKINGGMTLKFNVSYANYSIDGGWGPVGGIDYSVTPPFKWEEQDIYVNAPSNVAFLQIVSIPSDRAELYQTVGHPVWVILAQRNEFGNDTVLVFESWTHGTNPFENVSLENTTIIKMPVPAGYTCGYVNFERNTPALNDIIIPAGTEIMETYSDPADPYAYFRTVDKSIIHAGESNTTAEVVPESPKDNGKLFAKSDLAVVVDGVDYAEVISR